jgi:hypothetical protein
VNLEYNDFVSKYFSNVFSIRFFRNLLFVAKINN